MPEINGFPELSDGAQELLRIAIENDRHRAIANNAALWAALDWLGRLSGACYDPSGQGLQSLLHSRAVPRTFLEMTCAILQQMRSELDARLQNQKTPRNVPVVTDFDRHVLQAFAETLADVAWPERAANNFDGPPTEQVRARLGASNVSELYLLFIRNYLGNILQDCFAATRVRESVRNLDPDTELKLRSLDSAALASWVMEQVPRSGRVPVPSDTIRWFAAALRATQR